MSVELLGASHSRGGWGGKRADQRQHRSLARATDTEHGTKSVSSYFPLQTCAAVIDRQTATVRNFWPLENKHGPGHLRISVVGSELSQRIEKISKLYIVERRA